MQEKDSTGAVHSSKPVGICHRLFNFILSSLVGRIAKLPAGTLQPVAARGNQKLLPAQQHQNDIDDNYKDDDRNSSMSDDIEIHFKKQDHHDLLDQWTPVDKLGSSIYLANKKDDDQYYAITPKGKTSTSSTKERSKTIDHHDHDMKSKEIIKSRSKKIVTISDDHEKMKMKKRKGKSVAVSEMDKKLSLAIDDDDDDDDDHNHPRHLKPLLYAESNINEKSDAFIRAKKEAMRRNISITSKTS